MILPLHPKDGHGTSSRHELEGVCRWYDSLQDGSLKDSICSVRLLPPIVGNASEMLVYCRHPFSREALAFCSARRLREKETAGEALDNLLTIFRKWVAENESYTPRPFDGLVSVRWWPAELMGPGARKNNSLHEARRKLDDHALDSLELIRFAMLTDKAFRKKWHRSNDPFLAAGRIAYGTFEWIQEFPSDWTKAGGHTKPIESRLNEYAREYLGLVRMAGLFGHQSCLMDRLAEGLDDFRGSLASQFPRLRQMASRHLDSRADQEENGRLFGSDEYDYLNQIAGVLRGCLAESSRGFCEQIPAMINSFLPHLAVPDSAIYFIQES